MTNEQERDGKTEGTGEAGTRDPNLMLLYVALLLTAVFSVLFLATIVWHNTARLWLPEVLQGTVVLWLLATVLLGAVLLSLISRRTQNKWLWWLSVAVGIALTVAISLVLLLLWLLRDT